MSKPPTVREILSKTEAYFAGKGVDSPRLSAQLLLAEGLGFSRLDLILNMDRPLTEPELAKVRPLVARRGRGEPVAYILCRREFFGLEFTVGPGVLIPRPDSELFIEEALRLFAPDAPLAIADMGAGSGCLAVTLAKRFANASVTAIDLSPDALAVASANALAHDVAERVTFLEARFESLPAHPDGYDLIVANPPYVSEAEYAELSPEVAAFEPKTALVPGPTGLEAYPVVARTALDSLKPGGILLAEIGWKQGQAVRDMLAAPPFAFQDVTVLKDLAGNDRLVRARKPT